MHRQELCHLNYTLSPSWVILMDSLLFPSSCPFLLVSETGPCNAASAGLELTLELVWTHCYPPVSVSHVLGWQSYITRLNVQFRSTFSPVCKVLWEKFLNMPDASFCSWKSPWTTLSPKNLSCSPLPGKTAQNSVQSRDVQEHPSPPCLHPSSGLNAELHLRVHGLYRIVHGLQTAPWAFCFDDTIKYMCLHEYQVCLFIFQD